MPLPLPLNRTNESNQRTLALDTYTLQLHGTLHTSGDFLNWFRKSLHRFAALNSKSPGDYPGERTISGSDAETSIHAYRACPVVSAYAAGPGRDDYHREKVMPGDDAEMLPSRRAGPHRPIVPDLSRTRAVPHARTDRRTHVRPSGPSPPGAEEIDDDGDGADGDRACLAQEVMDNRWGSRVGVARRIRPAVL